MRNYKTPTPSELEPHIIKILSNGNQWQWNDIVKMAALHVGLTEADRKGDLFPNGDDRLNRYCANTLKKLTKEGSVKKIDYGLYQITNVPEIFEGKRLDTPPLKDVSTPSNQPYLQLSCSKTMTYKMKSNRRSYGKKDSSRNFSYRKQRALQRGKIRKEITTLTTPPQIIPPQKRVRKPVDARTFVQGCMGGGMSIGMFLFAFAYGSIIGVDATVWGFLVIGLLFGGGTLYQLKRNRDTDS